MATHATLGAVLGLLVGLILGLVIQLISFAILPLESFSDGPQSIAPFLGMGFGTLVGAILAGLVAIKK